MTHYWFENTGSADPNVCWDASKAVLRGSFRASMSIIRQNDRASREFAKSRVKEAKNQLILAPGAETYENWALARRSHELELVRRAKRREIISRQRSFEFGNKCSKLLVYMLRSNDTVTAIPRILSASGTFYTSSVDIAREFFSFYTDLYTSKSDNCASSIFAFLDRLDLPSLDNAARDALDLPISETEIIMAIDSFKKGLTPLAWLPGNVLRPQPHTDTGISQQPCGGCDPVFRNGKETRNKLLLISFDGFRWDYDQDVDTPLLDYLAEIGVKAKYITPPFVTMTSPSHFTTITGRWVEDHGVIHNLMHNPETQLKIPYRETQNMSEWWDNGVLPLWITAQNQGLKTGSLYFPGGNANYSGKTVYKAFAEYRNHPKNDEQDWRDSIDRVMKWFTDDGLEFVTLYFGEPDSTGHIYGPETEERKKIIQQIDRTVGYLLNAIENNNLKEHLNVIISSDHGMTTVKKEPNVEEEILLAKYITFKDLVKFDILDYGGSGMILPKEGKEDELYQKLKGAHPHLNIYRKGEFPERFHYSKHDRILPLLLYGDLGYSVNGRFILYVNKGDHGFDNSEMDMKMIFRAFGPDFKENYIAEPFDSIHIYPLMCKLLGITPEPHNGSLAVTQDMIGKQEVVEEKPDNKKSDAVFIAGIALSVMAGVLVLVFLIYVPYVSVKRSKRQRNDDTALETIRKDEQPQTSF
ncbi:ectonucleotide pyrophosphatase/phosphodiesterase family member 7-like [Hyperolius riggenbachi]|uniref:ectonucleotide pyrophosphatase/phosphodiesterase family member 7-like n=1 Tax=Hyperolius riggenbachi TaxID=752182 RepID=UPI0035A2C87F